MESKIGFDIDRDPELRRSLHRIIEQARQAIIKILSVMEICPVSRAVLESALGLGLVDFEDAVQVACAVAQKLDALVTRDTQDFSSSPLAVLSVQELLQRLKLQNI